MKRIAAGALFGALALAGFGMWSNVIALQFPWQFPWQPDIDFTEVAVELSLPEEARIVAIEPITLDCRARVHASIPIEGRREHTAFGRVYRTDTITMQAIGDVDTCIEGSSAQVQYNADGTTYVSIDADDIVFVRPRVDAVKSAESVRVSKGLVGKWTDVFPWVDDDLGLTPVTYAWAQNVIGGSQCMQAAYTVTEGILIDAYTEQFIANGADASRLTVEILGRPTFSDPPPLDLGGVEMNIDYDTITCQVSEDLQGGISTPITN